MGKRVHRRSRVAEDLTIFSGVPDGIDAVREWTDERWLQESVAAVERGRAQIAPGQSHDMDDVIAKLEAIVSPAHDRS